MLIDKSYKELILTI